MGKCRYCKRPFPINDLYRSGVRRGVQYYSCPPCERTRKLKFRDKYKARAQLQAAVSSGRIIRPANCEYGCLDRLVQAHHPDYSKPLEVRWLCPKHHAAQHPHKRIPPKLAPEQASEYAVRSWKARRARLGEQGFAGFMKQMRAAQKKSA